MTDRATASPSSDELHTELLLRSKQQGADLVPSDPEHLGDLVVVEIAIEAEDERQAILRGKFVEGIEDLTAFLTPGDAHERIRRVVEEVVVR